ncbi:unnamed protein product [Clavelina lepadiformis]|uniref:Uncharacterized protein n=1 Tax=Clavelina lepadiformis TaxID=159417 RepID=A0ABP0FGW7_CLALP
MNINTSNCQRKNTGCDDASFEVKVGKQVDGEKAKPKAVSTPPAVPPPTAPPAIDPVTNAEVEASAATIAGKSGGNIAAAVMAAPPTIVPTTPAPILHFKLLFFTSAKTVLVFET